MKLLHVPFTFHPDPVGGTEVYVQNLAGLLKQQGIRVVIAAPGDKTVTYTWDNIPIRRFAVTPGVSDLRELYGSGDEAAAAEFDRILSEERPSLVHLHASTRGVSLRLVSASKARGIPVVFTYHTATVTCARGTMMHWGTQSCDGLMDLHTCSRCTLHGLFESTCGPLKGMKNVLAKTGARLVGSLPPAFGSRLANHQGGYWTALRMTELIGMRHATTRALLRDVDHIVAVCQWVNDLLIRNGVPKEKITLCRQGVVAQSEVRPAELGTGNDGRVARLRPPSEAVRMAFLGRLDRTKGVHVLIQALRSLPDELLRLDIYGLCQGEAGRQYEKELRSLAQGDERITFQEPKPASAVISMLRDYDLIAVPSQWLETGPLVVMEAFAGAVPVVGSRLGGIAELVRDSVDGILVDARTTAEWSATFRRLSEDRTIIDGLRKNIRPPRTMNAVANEMVALYRKLLATAHSESPYSAQRLGERA